MTGLSLAAISAACGWFAIWIYRHSADLPAVRRTIKRIYAHLLEMRLFYDEPRLIWRAQTAVVRENLRFFLLIVRPAMILTLFMGWLLLQLQQVYGYGPLVVGRPSIVTAQVRGPLPAEFAAILQAPPEISIETP